jgi:DNA-binding IclR family transcriptional regulator
MDVIYLEKLHGHHAIGLMSSQVGGRLPAYCTSLGKVLLAYRDPERVRARFEYSEFHRYTDRTIQNVAELMHHLAQVHRQGYSLDRGEHEPEVRCVAAPIFDISGQVIAAVSVSGPASRLEPLDLNQKLIGQTLQAAQAISTRLGYHAVE